MRKFEITQAELDEIVNDAQEFFDVQLPINVPVKLLSKTAITNCWTRTSGFSNSIPQIFHNFINIRIDFGNSQNFHDTLFKSTNRLFIPENPTNINNVATLLRFPKDMFSSLFFDWAQIDGVAFIPCKSNNEYYLTLVGYKNIINTIPEANTFLANIQIPLGGGGQGANSGLRIPGGA